MGRGDQLAGLEQLVLISLMSLDGDEAYGMNIRMILAERERRAGGCARASGRAADARDHVGARGLSAGHGDA